MANKGPHTNNSIFYITLTDLPSLDDKNVAFGRVSKGFDTLYKVCDFSIVYTYYIFLSLYLMNMNTSDIDF